VDAAHRLVAVTPPGLKPGTLDASPADSGRTKRRGRNSFEPVFRSRGFSATPDAISISVNAGVRVICPSDSIDTADDDWPDRPNMCQMQHARSNFYTRQRIRRPHDGLWARRAAVGNTVIGSKRRPTVPATETEPPKGPFYDEINPEKVPVIHEVFAAKKVSGTFS
jgi:hypothetical protein